MSTGTRPEQRVSARAAVPQPWRAATPSLHVGAARRDQRRAAGGRRASGVLGGLGEGVAVGLGERPAPVLAGDLDQHDLSPGHRGDLGGERARVVGRDGDGEGHVRAATRRRGPAVTCGSGARRRCPAPSAATTRGDRVAQGAGRGGEQAPLAPGQPDRAPCQAVDRHPAPARPRASAGAAVAGTMAAPNPWNASVAMRRRPSTSALACSSMPAAAASRSSSSRNAVPLGSSRSSWSRELGEATRAPRRRAGGRRARSGCGPRRRAARWTPRGR